MANVVVTDTYISDIANAIRAKNGITTTYLPSQMPAAISAIPTGGGTGFTADRVAERTIFGSISGNASYIGSSAFQYCSFLTAASFPSCTSIRQYAFQYCSYLTTISFPVCTSIEYSAFQYCSSLTAASFPSCTSIGSYAFQYCSSLTAASFPVCTSIGNYAFRSCYHLLSLYLTSVSQVPTLGTNVFSSTPIGGYTTSTGGVYGSVFIPSSLYASFLTATNWSLISYCIVSV